LIYHTFATIEDKWHRVTIEHETEAEYTSLTFRVKLGLLVLDDFFVNKAECDDEHYDWSRRNDFELKKKIYLEPSPGMPQWQM